MTPAMSTRYGSRYTPEPLQVETLSAHLQVWQRHELHALGVHGRVTVDAFERDATQRMVLDLRAEFLCEEPFEERSTAETTFKVPATWWDCWKEEVAPDWFARRWPVQYRNVTVELSVPVKRYVVHPEHQITKDRARLQIVKDVTGAKDDHEARYFLERFRIFADEMGIRR